MTPKRITELLLAVKADPKELQELVTLINLGLWAEKHGIRALKSFHEWVPLIRGWNPISCALAARETALNELKNLDHKP